MLLIFLCISCCLNFDLEFESIKCELEACPQQQRAMGTSRRMAESTTGSSIHRPFFGSLYSRWWGFSSTTCHTLASFLGYSLNSGILGTVRLPVNAALWGVGDGTFNTQLNIFCSGRSLRATWKEAAFGQMKPWQRSAMEVVLFI